MSSGETGLLDLSPELLLNVTSFCEGRTLLSLTRTCRSMRRLSRLIYEEAIRNVLIRLRTEWPSDEASETCIREGPPPAVLRSWLGDDEKILGRYLFAIDTAEKVSSSFCWSKDCKHYHKLREVDKKELIALCEYLPHLIVSGCHPLLCRSITSLVRHLQYFHADLTWSSCASKDTPLAELGYRHHRSQLRFKSLIAQQADFSREQWAEWHMPNHSLHSRISFLIAWESIHRHCSRTGELFPGEETVGVFAGQVELQLEAHEYHPQMHGSDVLCFYYEGYRDNPAPDEPLQRQAILAQAVAEIAALLHDPHVRSTEWYILSLSYKLPVVDLGVAPPVPFYDSSIGSDRSWDSWLCNLLADACQASNIEGEWIGVSIGYWQTRVMGKIEFRVVSPTDHERESGLAAGDILITAPDCREHGGEPFEMHGSINQKTGQFNISKNYQNMLLEEEYWRGAMTPFGLVGDWGMVGSGHYGWQWLYKKSWCEAPTERYKDLPVNEVEAPPYPNAWQPTVSRDRPWLL